MLKNEEKVKWRNKFVIKKKNKFNKWYSKKA